LAEGSETTITLSLISLRCAAGYLDTFTIREAIDVNVKHDLFADDRGAGDT